MCRVCGQYQTVQLPVLRCRRGLSDSHHQSVPCLPAGLMAEVRDVSRLREAKERIRDILLSFPDGLRMASLEDHYQVSCTPPLTAALHICSFATGGGLMHFYNIQCVICESFGNLLGCLESRHGPMFICRFCFLALFAGHSHSSIPALTAPLPNPAIVFPLHFPLSLY